MVIICYYPFISKNSRIFHYPSSRLGMKWLWLCQGKSIPIFVVEYPGWNIPWKIPSSWLRAAISVWTSSVTSSMMPCSITRDEPGAFGSVFQTSHMELEAPILRHRQAGSQCITGFRSKDRLRSQLRCPQSSNACCAAMLCYAFAVNRNLRGEGSRGGLWKVVPPTRNMAGTETEVRSRWHTTDRGCQWQPCGAWWQGLWWDFTRKNADY